jgi:hypothetical protein
MIMINVNDAIQASQAFNRKMWLEHAGKALSDQIMSVANTGVRELKVCFKDLIIGAENLEEAAEMFYYIKKTLDTAGFEHVITPEGDLYINW